MVKSTIRLDVLRFVGSNEFSHSTMDAMATVPRHRFVLAEQQIIAYENHPLPIGYGQTISQPYIVAFMTDILHIDSKHRILEVGTGSGYQAAILSEVAQEVYSVEVIQALADKAKCRLQEIKYTNVHTKLGDGYYGWDEYAPYDGIMVTAVSEKVPPPLVEQLKNNGRMIIPIGTEYSPQNLVLLTKNSKGITHTKHVLPVRFVPLTGKH